MSVSLASSAAELSPTDTAKVAIVTSSVAMIGLAVIDSAMLNGVLGIPWRPVSYYFISYGEWLFAGYVALVFWSARSLGWASLPVALASLCVSYAAFSNFRGSWVWQGFFDRYEWSRVAWDRSVLVGLGLGLCMTVYAGMRPRPRPMAQSKVDLALFLLAVASLWVYFEPRFHPIESNFAPTRFIPYGIVATVLAVFYLLSRFEP